MSTHDQAAQQRRAETKALVSQMSQIGFQDLNKENDTLRKKVLGLEGDLQALMEIMDELEKERDLLKNNSSQFQEAQALLRNEIEELQGSLKELGQLKQDLQE